MTTQSRISRRGFLKLSCLTAAAAGSAVCGVTLAAPALPPIELQSITNEGVNMKKRVLVTYATYAGSTIDVAVAISEKLTAQGLSVDVKPVNENPQIDNYRAVLIGSAVQHANWLPEAVDFVTAQQDALNRLPVALFCVHIQNQGDDDSSRQNRRSYLNQVRPLLNPVAEGFFAGKFDRRGAALLLPGWLAPLVPPLDFRNWVKIRAWADKISPLLLQS